MALNVIWLAFLVMSLQDIYTRIENAPTIMDIGEALQFMEEVSKFSDEELFADYINFEAIVDRLMESHINGGVFEVDDTNRSRIASFCTRLRNLAEKLKNVSEIQGRKRQDEFLLGAAETLEAEMK